MTDASEGAMGNRASGGMVTVENGMGKRVHCQVNLLGHMMGWY